jgi:hypothetical protein
LTIEKKTQVEQKMTPDSKDVQGSKKGRSKNADRQKSILNEIKNGGKHQHELIKTFSEMAKKRTIQRDCKYLLDLGIIYKGDDGKYYWCEDISKNRWEEHRKTVLEGMAMLVRDFDRLFYYDSETFTESEKKSLRFDPNNVDKIRLAKAHLKTGYRGAYTLFSTCHGLGGRVDEGTIELNQNIGSEDRINNKFFHHYKELIAEMGKIMRNIDVTKNVKGRCRVCTLLKKTQHG